MAKKYKAAPFQGSKLYIQQGSEKNIRVTGATLEPATVSVDSGKFKPNDVIILSDAGDLNGIYPVDTVEGNKLTLCPEVSWKEKTLPDSFNEALAERVLWSNNFCAVRSLSKDGSTTEQVDVTTMCSDGKEFEPGDTDYGTLKLTFFYRPTTAIQSLLRRYENDKEKFSIRLTLTRGEGTVFYYGSIETGMNIEGSTGQMYESGVSIKLSGRDYINPEKSKAPINPGS